MPYLIEETYEVVDAIQALDPDDPSTDVHMIEELGDLLYQIEFHATIAEQEGRFTIADVTAGHPRQARAPSPARVPRRPRASRSRSTAPRRCSPTGMPSSAPRRAAHPAFDGVPELAALTRLRPPAPAARLPSSASTGPTSNGALPKIVEEAAELVAACEYGRPRGDRRRARRPAVRGRQRRPPPRRRPGIRAAGRIEQVSPSVRTGRGAGRRAAHRSAWCRPDTTRRPVGRGQTAGLTADRAGHATT